MLVARAEEFARLVHKSSTISHLKEVVLTIKELGITQDEVLLASAWLYLTLKDTDTTYNTLKLQFGNEVADIVYLLTYKSNEELKNNEKVLLIKLVDIVVNTEYAIDNDSNSYEIYRKEFPLLRDTLYDETSISYPIIYLWYYLENLYRDENERLSVEEIENIAKDIYSYNLDEEEALEEKYYDDCYQIVEERMYDQ